MGAGRSGVPITPSAYPPPGRPKNAGTASSSKRTSASPSLVFRGSQYLALTSRASAPEHRTALSNYTPGGAHWSAEPAIEAHFLWGRPLRMVEFVAVMLNREIPA